MELPTSLAEDVMRNGTGSQMKKKVEKSVVGIAVVVEWFPGWSFAGVARPIWR